MDVYHTPFAYKMKCRSINRLQSLFLLVKEKIVLRLNMITI